MKNKITIYYPNGIVIEHIEGEANVTNITFLDSTNSEIKITKSSGFILYVGFPYVYERINK